MAKKKLKDQEIERALAIPSGSEDGKDFSDADSDDDTKKNRQVVDHNLEDSEEEVDVTTVQNETLIEENISLYHSAGNRISRSTSSNSGHSSSSKRKYTQVSGRNLSNREDPPPVSVQNPLRF
ncbi:hypothetical protein O0L34_g6774 [Tuta absoluta]|nr:hypothetical protein O0L34_g6774 [Tuta absoluta]